MDPVAFQHILSQQRLLKGEETVIVGVSAGPDSVALLSLLHSTDLDLTLVPVYVDHGLRPEESRKESRLVQELADRFHLDCEIVAVDVLGHKKATSSSLEESARHLRYNALESCRQQHGGKVIAVGHTADDQAEEMLLRLFRGTGLRGLSGMRRLRDNIIRPLLDTPKEELLTYLKEAGIDYCLDSSNSDRSILRNRMRLDILPAIARHFNSAIRSTLLQTADILQKDEEYLNEATATALAEVLVPRQDDSSTSHEVNIDLSSFLHHHPAIQRRIMEKALHSLSLQPTFGHINDAIGLVKKGRNGAELHLPQGIRIVKNRTCLVLSQPRGNQAFRGSHQPAVLHPLKVALDKEYRLEELGIGIKVEKLLTPPVEIPANGLLLSLARISFPLVLRSPYPGERFSPQGLQGSKKVSRFLADSKIPRRMRHKYPVLVSREKVAAVAGLRADNLFTAGPAEPCLLLQWQLL